MAGYAQPQSLEDTNRFAHGSGLAMQSLETALGCLRSAAMLLLDPLATVDLTAQELAVAEATLRSVKREEITASGLADVNDALSAVRSLAESAHELTLRHLVSLVPGGGGEFAGQIFQVNG